MRWVGKFLPVELACWLLGHDWPSLPTWGQLTYSCSRPGCEAIATGMFDGMDTYRPPPKHFRRW